MLFNFGDRTRIGVTKETNVRGVLKRSPIEVLSMLLSVRYKLDKECIEASLRSAVFFISLQMNLNHRQVQKVLERIILYLTDILLNNSICLMDLIS